MRIILSIFSLLGPVTPWLNEDGAATSTASISEQLDWDHLPDGSIKLEEAPPGRRLGFWLRSATSPRFREHFQKNMQVFSMTAPRTMKRKVRRRAIRSLWQCEDDNSLSSASCLELALARKNRGLSLVRSTAERPALAGTASLAKAVQARLSRSPHEFQRIAQNTSPAGEIRNVTGPVGMIVCMPAVAPASSGVVRLISYDNSCRTNRSP